MSGRGDEVRFRGLWQAHYRAIRAYAHRRCANPTDAADLVSETFLVLWRRLDDAPADQLVLPWLYEVARRILSNQQRTRARRQQLLARLRALPQQAPPTVEAAAADRAASATVLRALGQLNDRDREVLLLAAWDGLSHAQIAQVLGCSENAATVRLHRARQRLTEVYRTENARPGHKRSDAAPDLRNEGNDDER